MPRSSRRASTRAGYRDRHGRGIRSAVTGPHLPMLRTRVDFWRIDPRERRVVLYRVPIERLVKLHRDDDWHRRSYIESCVFRAVAELLGKDPWDIAPERYRHF